MDRREAGQLMPSDLLELVCGELCKQHQFSSVRFREQCYEYDVVDAASGTEKYKETSYE